MQPDAADAGGASPLLRARSPLCARAPAASSPARLPTRWQRLAPHVLRQGQIETLLAQAKYSDVLSRQPTGSGKTLSMLIPMVSAHLETLAGSGPGSSLPALGLIVVPWRSLCFDLEREANEYLKWVADRWSLEVRPRALFVDREGGGREGDGERLGEEGGEGGEAFDRCCRFTWSTEAARWCKWCAKPSNAGTQRTSGCLEARVRAQRAAGGGGSTDQTSGGDGASTGAGGGGGGGGGGGDAHECALTLADLPRHAPERCVAEDRTLAVLLVTPEALFSESDRGALLRRELVKSRRVRNIALDEAHACLQISAASYRPACAAIGARIASLRNEIELEGGASAARPRFLAQTATLPPALEAEAVRRLRLGDEHVVVRGPVDRPTIAFARLLVPELSGEESAAAYALRAWQCIAAWAPAAALAGHRIIYITKALQTRLLAHYFAENGVPAVPYATNGMTPLERAASLDAWRADRGRILIASAAFGQGINLRTVTLVAHMGLPQDVLEYFQQVGRIRDAGLAVTVLRPRYLIERLALPLDDGAQLRYKATSVAQLVGVLTSPWCLRAAVVEWLGGAIDGCTECDSCVAFGSVAAGARAAASSSAALRPAACDCGAFPFDLRMVVGNEAAAVVLRSLGDEEKLLSSALEAVPPGAPSPFDQRSAHGWLVVSLIGARHLAVRIERGRHGCFALVAAVAGALHALEVRGEQHLLLLPRCFEVGVRDDGAIAVPRALLLQQQAVRVQLGEARRALAATWATLEHAFSGGADVLLAMGVSVDDMRMLRAALPSESDKDEGAGGADVSTTSPERRSNEVGRSPPSSKRKRTDSPPPKSVGSDEGGQPERHSRWESGRGSLSSTVACLDMDVC